MPTSYIQVKKECYLGGNAVNDRIQSLCGQDLAAGYVACEFGINPDNTGLGQYRISSITFPVSAVLYLHVAPHG